VPTILDAPSSANVGQTISISWTVSNQGTGVATPAWSDSVVLSTDSTFGGGDPVLLTTNRNTALNAGASCNAGSTVSIPLSTVPGSNFLILRADATGSQEELNEGNNDRTRPITITMN
jgi:subtilase family serine protease